MRRKRLTSWLLAILPVPGPFAYAWATGTACLCFGCCDCATDSRAPAVGKRAVDAGVQVRKTKEFGDVRMGSKSELLFDLVNETAEPVEIANVKTSCDCFRLELDSMTIGPRQVSTVKAVLDLSSDPGFSGKLRLEAEALDRNGEEVFRVQFDVNVVQ